MRKYLGLVLIGLLMFSLISIALADSDNNSGSSDSTNSTSNNNSGQDDNSTSQDEKGDNGENNLRDIIERKRDDLKKRTEERRKELREKFEDNKKELRERTEEEIGKFKERIRERIHKENKDDEDEFESEYHSRDGRKIKLKIKERMKNGIAERRMEYREGNKSLDIKTKLKLIELFNNETNESIFETKLSNGSRARIMLLKEQILEEVLKQLKTQNYTIEMKEKIHKNVPRVIYNIETNKHGRFLGIFKMRMRMDAEVDPETGKVDFNKPWWAFLVSGEDNPEDEIPNDNSTIPNDDNNSSSGDDNSTIPDEDTNTTIPVNDTNNTTPIVNDTNLTA